MPVLGPEALMAGGSNDKEHCQVNIKFASDSKTSLLARGRPGSDISLTGCSLSWLDLTIIYICWVVV